MIKIFSNQAKNCNHSFYKSMEISRINQNIFYQPRSNKSQKTQNKDISFKGQNGIYPVYTQLPYGINTRPYIKLSENTLPTGDKFCTYKLINGQTVTIVQKNGCPMIKTAFKSGAMDDPDGLEGISHFIEHSIYHESEKYKDVEQAIKDIGAYSNAGTSTYCTNYYIQLPDDNKETLKQALDIEADMIFHPKFSKLDKEKRIVTKEAKQGENSESINIFGLIKKTLFSINKPHVKDLLTGSEESINLITKDNMLRYHQYHYIPQNATTSVVTPYEPDEIIDMVSNAFLSATRGIENHPIQRKQYNPINHMVRKDIISKENNRTKINFGFLLNNLDLKKIAAGFILAEWFSRYSNFDYDINDDYDNSGTLSFIYNETDENEYLAFEKLKEDIAGLSNNPIDEASLKDIKEKAIENEKKKFQNNDSITGVLTDNMLLYGSYAFDAFENIINGLTAQDIMMFARELDMNKCIMSVSHKKGTTLEELKNKHDEYKNYVTPVCVPKTKQDIDITNQLSQYDISPYHSGRVLNTVLADNTNLSFINSKNDECVVLWNLLNPDLKDANPAIKYILSELFGNSAARIFLKPGNVKIKIPVAAQGMCIKTECKQEELDETLAQIKYVFDIEFTQENFEDAKRKAKDAIKFDSSMQSAQDMFFADIEGKNYTLNEKELLDALEKLTLNEVKDYYNRLITNSYSTAVAKVPFEKNAALINKVANAIYVPNFAFRSGRNDKKIYKPGGKKCYIKEKNQPEYAQIYSYKTNGNTSDEMKFQLTSRILSQRLFDLLREKRGLAYDVGSYGNRINDLGTVQLCITTNLKDEKDIKEIFGEFDKEIQRLMNEPVTEEELKKAKSFIKVSLLQNWEDSMQPCINMLCSFSEPFGIASLQNNIEIIDSAKPEDISAAAKYMFQNAPDYLIEADKETIDKNEKYFETLGIVSRN